MTEEVKRNREFSIPILNEDGLVKSEIIRDFFDYFLNQLSEICPDCREFSIAKTKLEEACFFAKKAMAINNVSE